MAREIPTYNIPAILAQKSKITDSLAVMDFQYTVPNSVQFLEFVDVIESLLPDRVPYQATRKSCEYLRGEELTEDAVHDLAWRLAGNIRRLRSGHPALPWTGIPKKEWMPIQVVQVDFALSKRGHAGGKFTIKFLAGQACPLETEVFWSRSYCQVLASRLGFTKWASSKHPFQDVAELVNFRMLVEVEPGQQEPTFEKVEVPSSLKEWNRRYIKMRSRELPGFDCPRKLPRSKFCFRCYYGQDRCPAAVRTDTLIKLPCGQCAFTKYHDPQNATVCIGCHQANLRKELG